MSPSIAYWDTETDGLLPQLTKLHCAAVELSDGTFISAALNQPPRPPIEDALAAAAEADLRVAHNAIDFDERAARKVYPQWDPPMDKAMDTLVLSRLIYPQIQKSGPNTHKVPPQMRRRHSLAAWGHRLGVAKDTEFDGGDWQTWTPEMQAYMNRDIPPLKRLFQWLMSHKPAPEAVRIEHQFQAIISRQEAWGFTFDMEKALVMQAELSEMSRKLELELGEAYGEWWAPGKVVTVKASREVTMKDHPNITRSRVSKAGKPLKDYVGPPKCSYEAGAQYTQVTRTQFNPTSREHVRLILKRDHGWEPTKFTEHGAAKVDDEVLRALPWPAAHRLADLFFIEKILGFANAWLKAAHEEADAYRQHGRHMAIGTWTFRGAHTNPNLGQVPTRDPEWGHRCRELFTASPPQLPQNEAERHVLAVRGSYDAPGFDACVAAEVAESGFKLVGFDGSGIQLRGLASYTARYDGGVMAGMFVRGEDPHGFVRDAVQDLLGPSFAGEDMTDPKLGRARGKTINYALCFGGGDGMLGFIIAPLETISRQKAIGKEARLRLESKWPGWPALKRALEDRIQTDGFLLGLDGRKMHLRQPRLGLAGLLQMFEAVVMKKALCILDSELQAAGLRPGADRAGHVNRALADYEYCANVHDEVQADVRPQHVELYKRLALQCVTKAGLHFKLKCPLASEVNIGDSWKDTH